MSDQSDRELPRPPDGRQIHHHTLDSNQLEQLIESPVTSDEAENALPPNPGTLRDLIRQLTSPSGGYGRWDSIFYLHGDERRAIRKAVRCNEEFIVNAFADSDKGNNPFAQGWSERWYQMLCEEWEYHRRRVAEESEKESLPTDFFERLSPKKKALLQILLDADGEWVRGVDIRQQMRDDYDLTVPNKPGALAIHLSHYTQWYSEDFRRNLIPGRWVEDSHNHAEFRIGEKYEDELRDWFKTTE